MKFDLKDVKGHKVISLEVVRKNFESRAQFDKCAHANVRVDVMLAHLHCVDCSAELNPVEWIGALGEYWQHVEYLYERLTAQREEIAQLDKALELKRRATCEHCQRVTRVRIPTSYEARRRLRVVPKD